jgi:hypothetical protein
MRSDPAFISHIIESDNGDLISRQQARREQSAQVLLNLTA